MSASEIPKMGGEFLLCYYSNNLQSIVGISEPFQVIHLEALINVDAIFFFLNIYLFSSASEHSCVNSGKVAAEGILKRICPS